MWKAYFVPGNVAWKCCVFYHNSTFKLKTVLQFVKDTYRETAPSYTHAKCMNMEAFKIYK